MADQLGLKLARVVRRHGLSVEQVAEYTGATRCTVYNWMSGKGVSIAYAPRVLKFIEKMLRKTK